MPVAISRFPLLRSVAVLAALLPLAFGVSARAVDEPVALDLIIEGGTIFTGDDAPPQVGDVGIAGDRIVFVGRAAPHRFVAKRRIDARGQVVAPGFIDPHTHADRDLFHADARRRLNVPFLTQGVTTAVIGSDGFGGADIAAQAQRLRDNGAGTNTAIYVGFGPVRAGQLGEANRAPTSEQLDAMRAQVSRAMCEGALGLSTGLLCTAEFRADRGGDRAGQGRGAPRRPVRQPHPRRVHVQHRPQGLDRRGDPHRARS